MTASTKADEPTLTWGEFKRVVEDLCGATDSTLLVHIPLFNVKAGEVKVGLIVELKEVGVHGEDGDA